MLRLVRNDFYAGLSVRKMHNGHRTHLMDNCLRALLVRQPMRDRYMPSLCIDTHHFATEELAVHTRVAPLIDGNIVMNHLMQDSVLDQCLRKINTHIDAEHEVLVPIATEQALFAARKRHFAEKAFRVAEFDWQRRQLAFEIGRVVFIKSRLYVFDCWCHAAKVL